MTSPPATADALARAAVLRVGRRIAHGTLVLHDGSTPSCWAVASRSSR